VEHGRLLGVGECTFPHWVNFKKPQVLPVPFWDSNSKPLNGRFVMLLEVRDHQISPPEPFPGDVAAVDSVVANEVLPPELVG
jgi:hypothetical protein